MENHERVERELLEQCDQVATLAGCFAWLQRCDECIEQLEELCRTKRPRLAVGQRRSAEAKIARLAGAKSQLERRFMHVGGEYAGSGYASGNERSLVWREIEAAFESRIATGAVINYNHIEPRRFLEDAGDIVLERVRDAVERHGSVKVNTAFNGEFATKDKRANKSIITKNSEIYRCTDMREDKHVNVLYLQDPRDDNVGHFAWIKDLSRLVNSQLTRKEHKKYFCDRFIDSFKFLSTSLEKLASYLDKNKLQIVRSEFTTLSDEEFELLTRKGIFPYEYIDCVEKLQDTRLPSRESFFSSLTGDTVSESDYAHIHYRNLQQCTRHGLRVTKIHRILQFAQSLWLRDYIELNTKFRTVAKNEFEKNLYKLMNNAVFGKTTENVRNHVDVKLVTKWDGRYGAEAMIAKPNFHSRSVFAENLIAVELRKLEVKFNKPIYVGMCILDISKVCLYEFHHEYMSPMYRDKCKIMYTDTDSLIYRIECDDAYETMKRDIARFDTSDYPADNVYGMPLVNKKVPGLMKDENNGMIMTEFVGLRAKMYAVRVDGKKDTKKVKGVKSNVVARTITFDDYTRCLNEEIEMTRRQSCIRSKLHEVYTISESKIALSPYDDTSYPTRRRRYYGDIGGYLCNICIIQ
ncbi:hypothetical protein ALC57_04058 [Trachymyrmex cornetzi]|uniref:DNA-directed DNA polymerase n=1 Tax=Trachymyrmex cornetzi TaxID=471704 RepID=A0A151JF40_9HYME|nr:hypothetical protein ALC57_04058 [Trachymyrmex cornetzi]